ncbi:hypothetical protein DL239_18840 [Sedimentitalea sp. CY04]|uniref:ATPase AAA-type core domain-containing protein n=1 Tax=Parasedimentitalea denitrificans TaxID=2211118 RepID=A0ABX0WBH5_9RHOB|nr:AAA family ATPase [Sedimentitalea sp. CY04]NIZ63026.1 hypothetical protein [Sedimentitalea sp. CY04]
MPSSGQDNYSFSRLLGDLQPGATHIVTGKNGAGKSRFFNHSTTQISEELLNGRSKFSRLLCMAGTMHDKYPRQIYMSKSLDDESIVYLGNKVNNNMISDIAPFRVLLRSMLNPSNPAYRKSDFLSHLLSRINLGTNVKLKFRYGKGRKGAVIDTVETEYSIDLSDPYQLEVEASNLLHHVEKGDLLLSDMSFEKSGQYLGLPDLSSGEKQYILSLLGIVFCGAAKSVAFFDEPENSLHPSWQLRIARDLSQAMQEIHSGSTLVIATHSPLVASSLSNGNVYLCDLPNDQTWTKVNIYGRSSDTVLRDQFHLFSARSPEVTKVINSCLSHIAKGEEASAEFVSKKEHLRALRIDLKQDDPLADVVSTILGL